MMLSDVCRVHPVGGRRVRPAGWMARIGRSDPARPAWLKAAAARFRCRRGRGHIVAAVGLQLIFSFFSVLRVGFYINK